MRFISPLTTTSRVALVALSVCASAAAVADTMNARAFGRGDTGLALGGFYGALDNPALINASEANDDFGFNLNVGVLAADKDDMLSDAEDVEDGFDDLETMTASSQTTSDLNASMQAMDQKAVRVEAGAAILIAIPNKVLPAALVVRNHTRLAARFDYDDRDEATLAAVGAGAPYDPEAIESEMRGDGVAISEAGLTLGRAFDSETKFGPFQVGATLKLQRINVYEYDMKASNYDQDDFTDDENMEEHSGFNVDLGVIKPLGEHYAIAMRIENLVPQDYEGPSGDKYEMGPQVTVGAAMDRGWVKAELDVDANAHEGFGELEEVQYVKTGLEFDAFRWAQLRVGYRHDMKDNVEGMATAGIGLSPFGVVNLDIAGMKGSGDSYGALVQLGYRF